MLVGGKSGTKALQQKVRTRNMIRYLFFFLVRGLLESWNSLLTIPTQTAIQGYDSRITKAINQLLGAIDRHKNQPLDVSKWFAFLVFDIMEDLAFNKSSNMLENGQEAYVFKTIRTDMFNIALFTHLPWLLPFIKRTPVLNWNYLEFLDWIQKLIDERKQVRFLPNPFPNPTSSKLTLLTPPPLSKTPPPSSILSTGTNPATTERAGATRHLFVDPGRL